jgi:hypothetical protein
MENFLHVLRVSHRLHNEGPLTATRNVIVPYDAALQPTQYIYSKVRGLFNYYNLRNNKAICLRLQIKLKIKCNLPENFTKHRIPREIISVLLLSK